MVVARLFQRASVGYFQHLLLAERFPVVEIAAMIHIPVRTVKYRMNRLGISVRQLFSTISDHDLDMLVDDLLEVNPNLGK